MTFSTVRRIIDGDKEAPRQLLSAPHSRRRMGAEVLFHTT
jgi:hypothetical protein